MEHLEYLLECTGEVIITPGYGWAVQGGAVISNSLPYAYYASPPSLEDLFAVRLGWGRFRHFPRIVSLRDVGEGNYFHFFNDIIGKLVVLPDTLRRSCVFLIAEKVFSKPYCQEFLQLAGFDKSQFFPQRDEYVVTPQAFFCKSMPFSREKFRLIVSALDVPDPDATRPRRIFLTRSPSVARNVANLDLLLPILGRHGFDVIDTAEMSLIAQARLFADAEAVIGIHGAGLTNIMFRRGKPLRVLEIFPPDNIPPHYRHLCHAFGYEYDAMIGHPLYGALDSATSSPSFVVDPTIFASKVGRLIPRRGSDSQGGGFSG